MREEDDTLPFIDAIFHYEKDAHYLLEAGSAPALRQRKNVGGYLGKLLNTAADKFVPRLSPNKPSAILFITNERLKRLS